VDWGLGIEDWLLKIARLRIGGLNQHFSISNPAIVNPQSPNPQPAIITHQSSIINDKSDVF
jgi:hypothetical protein